jgi:hypothetical protein
VPSIIRDLPYFDQPTRVQVRGRSFSVKRDQIVVWINITEQGIKQLDPRVPRFPAILDIGCNYNLLINEQHLTGWAGIQPGYLRQLVRMRVAGELVSHLAANAWLYPNVPGKRDDLASLPPFLLELLPGIAVYPAKEGHPCTRDCRSWVSGRFVERACRSRSTAGARVSPFARLDDSGRLCEPKRCRRFPVGRIPKPSLAEHGSRSREGSPALRHSPR